MTARAHTTAVAALVAGEVTCFVGQSTNSAAPPFAVLFPDSGRGSDTSLTFDTDMYAHTFQTTSVGSTVEQAQWVADKVRAAIEDVTPTVPGWSTSPIRHQMSQVARRDDDVDPARFYAVDVWTYRAIPSA